MQVVSTRFGAFDVRDDTVIEFPDGLIGLDGKRFVLIAREEQLPFYWLHSADDPGLALPVTNPWLFVPEYEVRVPDEDARRLGLDSADGAQILCVVRTDERPEDCSLNLAAPVVVNLHDRVGRQIINDGSGYSVRHPLFSEVELEEARAAAETAAVAATAV